MSSSGITTGLPISTIFQGLSLCPEEEPIDLSQRSAALPLDLTLLSTLQPSESPAGQMQQGGVSSLDLQESSDGDGYRNDEGLSLLMEEGCAIFNSGERWDALSPKEGNADQEKESVASFDLGERWDALSPKEGNADQEKESAASLVIDLSREDSLSSQPISPAPDSKETLKRTRSVHSGDSARLTRRALSCHSEQDPLTSFLLEEGPTVCIISGTTVSSE